MLLPSKIIQINRHHVCALHLSLISYMHENKTTDMLIENRYSSTKSIFFALYHCCWSSAVWHQHITGGSRAYKGARTPRICAEIEIRHEGMHELSGDDIDDDQCACMLGVGHGRHIHEETRESRCVDTCARTGP